MISPDNLPAQMAANLHTILGWVATFSDEDRAAFAQILRGTLRSPHSGQAEAAQLVAETLAGDGKGEAR